MPRVMVVPEQKGARHNDEGRNRDGYENKHVKAALMPWGTA